MIFFLIVTRVGFEFFVCFEISMSSMKEWFRNFVCDENQDRKKKNEEKKWHNINISDGFRSTQ